VGRRIFAVIVAALFVYVASPLILPVAMGAVLATLFLPLLERLESRRVPTALASAGLTLGIALFLILPSSILIFAGVKDTLTQLQALKAQAAAVPSNAVPGVVGDGWAAAFLSMPKVYSLLQSITQWFPIEMADLTEAAQDLVRTAVAKGADILGGFIASLPGMVLATAVSVVSIYFFLCDGRRAAHFFRRNSVFSAQQTDQLFLSLAGTCRSVILASVVSGAAQSLLYVLICLIAQVPNAAMIGLLVFLGSFIPVIGAVPVTVGVAIQQYALANEGTAVVLLAAAGVVSLIDNLIRPLFLKGSANLHPLLAFVSAFGGLQTLGFSGIFIGPIIAAMFVVTAQILFQGDEPLRKERPVL
jgi:predicted PurR-regulated permease PerM